MDFGDLLKLATNNLSRYFEVSTATLLAPAAHFAPSSPTRLAPRRAAPKSGGVRLNSQLLLFVIISLFLGATVNSLIPDRINPPERATAVILCLFLWVTYASCIHIACKLLRGKGSYSDTLSVSLQLFATLYVVTSLVALVVAVLMRAPIAGEFVYKLTYRSGGLAMVLEEPAFLFFLFNALLLAFYLPIAIKHVHGFGLIRQLVVALPLVLISLFLGLAIYAQTGVMSAPASPG